MLGTGDADLAARDARLPGLAALLDADAFAAALRTALPDHGIASAEATYVRYKPRTSCLVAYRVTLDDGREALAYGRAERAGDGGKLAGNVRRASAEGPLGRGLLLREHGIAVYPFPNDRRLTALPAIADPERRRRLLARKLPDRPALHDASLVPLRLKPERRFVGLLDGAGERAVIKLYAGGFEAASTAARALTALPVRTPRRLAISRRRHAVILGWEDGEPLADALHRGEAEAAVCAGDVLAALHGAPAGELAATRRGDEAGDLLRAARATAWLLPEAAEPLRRMTGALAAELERQEPLTPVHGDFSADQVLAGGDAPVLLDTDEARLGRPIRDLATFNAALELDALRGALDRATAGRASRALLDGYAGAGGRAPSAPALRRWTAAGLLRVAPEPFRHRDAAWPELTRALVERAEELVGG